MAHPRCEAAFRQSPFPTPSGLAGDESRATGKQRGREAGSRGARRQGGRETGGREAGEAGREGRK